MDFDLTATQQAVADVVTSVLDRDNSWEALVAGGVTALPVPERLGGDGVGLPEVAHGADRRSDATAPSRRRWQRWASVWCHCWTWHPTSNRTGSWPESAKAAC